MLRPEELTIQQALVIYPDGRHEVHPWPDERGQLPLMQQLVGGHIEYVNPGAHRLETHEVVVNETGMIDGLPSNWPGSRWVGYDLARLPPLSGPVLVVPHDPHDPPIPTRRRNSQEHGGLFGGALRGDPAALAALGVESPDQIFVIDARPDPELYLYAIHPDGRTERYDPEFDVEAAHAWVRDQLGEAYALPPTAQVVQAYTVLYAQQPASTEPNIPASAALGLWGMRHLRGAVILLPTGEYDPSFLHERLDRALHGDAQAQGEIGLTLAFTP